MNVFELFGTIAINNEQANKALADTGKQAGGLSKTMESAFGKLQGTAKKIGAAVATAFAVDKIKDFGKSCAETYASVAAEQSSFEQIMGDYSVMASEKMNQVAENTGVVATRLTPYMTSLTAKFKGLGYGVDEATSLASEGLTIASDAAAFWDKSLDESMSHLNSFINGSYEGGEAIGLFANDTQMAAYAVEKGIVKQAKAWSALDEATKQSTRMRYAKEMMASSGATGQAAKEADAYANIQANLNEQFRQFQAIIGEPIMNNIMLPAMRRLSSMMPGITEKTEKFVRTFANGLNKAAAYFKSRFSNVFSGDGIDFGKLGLAVGSVVGDVIQKISSMFSTLTSDIPGLLNNVGQAISTAWNGSVWPFIQGFFKAAFEIELPDWATFVSNITDGWNTQVWPNIQEFFKANFEITLPDWTTIEQSVRTTFQNIKTTISNSIEEIKGFFNFEWSLPDIKLPHFSISGSFSLNPPSIPTIGVEWYKKAMDNPMLMTRPTAFGINTNGQIMAGGESGAEVVSGAGTLMGMISDSVSSQNAVMVQALERIYAVLVDMRNSGSGQQIVLDSGVLVGQLAPALDTQLGTTITRKGRRN